MNSAYHICAHFHIVHYMTLRYNCDSGGEDRVLNKEVSEWKKRRIDIRDIPRNREKLHSDI